MVNKYLLYFTGQCLSLDDHPEFRETIINNFSNGKIKPDDFIKFCSDELILPAIYLIFRKHNLMQVFPTDYSKKIIAIYLQNTNRNHDILKQVEEINSLLIGKNIITVYLKGVGNLLDNLFSDMGERMIGDIDLLVQDKDYLKTAQILLDSGYKTYKRVYNDVTTLKHYPRLYKKGHPVDVEIHRLPVNEEYTKDLDTLSVFQNKKVAAANSNCFVPSDEHKSLHNFVHAQLNNHGHLFKIISLRDFYDFYLIMKRTNFSDIILQTTEKTKLMTYYYLLSKIFNIQGLPDVINGDKQVSYLKSIEWYSEHPNMYNYYIFIQLSKLRLSRLWRY